MHKAILSILTQTSGLDYCPECQAKYSLPKEDPVALGRCDVCKSDDYLIHAGSYCICFEANYDLNKLKEPKKLWT